MAMPIGGRIPPLQISDSDFRWRIGEILNRWPAVGLAVGLIRGGDLAMFQSHGFANLTSRAPITPDTVFRVASITKTFTAIAVMQLWEQGLVDLDAPAGNYLRAFRLVPRRPGLGAPTLRHLLTHTSGIPEVRKPWDGLKPVFGEIVPAGDRVPRLADHYRGGLAVRAEPGTRFVYTDHGFATLGQIIEDVTGTPLRRYLNTKVFAPLGMTDTELGPSYRLASRLATGYRVGSGGPREVSDYDPVTAGASAAYSTARDMSRYVEALAGGGRNAHGVVLKPKTLAMMFAPQYRPDPRSPGIGLSFFRQDLAGHLAVEHSGVLPGFNSQIFVAPDEGTGVVALTNGSPHAMFWMPGECAGLLAAEIGLDPPRLRTEVAQHPEVWEEVRGRYQVAAGITDIRARLMAGGGIEVLVQHGRLIIREITPVRPLRRGFVLHPDDPRDPYAFRVDLSEFGVGMVRALFRPAPEGTTLHFDFMPITMRRRHRRSPAAALAGLRRPARRASGGPSGVDALRAGERSAAAGRIPPERDAGRD